MLGSTYQAVALILAVFPLVFPDALRPGALLGGSQSPVNLYYLWHLVFTIGILTGSLVYWRDQVTLRRPGLRLPVSGWVLATLLGVGVLLSVDLWFPDLLPVLMSDSIGGTRLMDVADALLLVLAAITCAVTLALARRGSLMSVYLAGVGVSLLGLGVVNTSTTDRWSLGWYAIRGFSLAAISVLLVLLIWALSRIDRASVEQLERDTLTGASRRIHFSEQLAFELDRIRAGHGGGGALLWIDLDAFKAVNDRLGHHAGDHVLARVGQRILAAVGPHDLVGRVGGDEFGVLGLGLTASEVLDLAEHVRLVLRAPYELDQASALLTASIGAVAITEPVPSAQELLHRADLAASQAKAAGGDQVATYTTTVEADVRRRAGERAQLSADLRAGRFDLDYQPIIRPGTGEVVGVEALARQLRAGSRIPAAQFITAIEATGQIRELGAQVMAVLNRDAPRILAALPADGFITVNVSVTELAATEHWLPLLAGPLTRQPARLVFEVTETADLVPGTPADLALAGLRDAGHALAVDDFGTGYSNFDRLEAMRPTILKLDRGVVTRAGAGQATARHFLAASVSIGHDIGALVLAEGVETPQELRIVTDLGADLVQGWYYSRAVPLEELLDLIRTAPIRTAPSQPAAALPRQPGLQDQVGSPELRGSHLPR